MSLVAFIAAMLCKPSAVAVPLVLFILDSIWLVRPIGAASRSVLPFAALAVPCLIWTKLAQPSTLIAPIPLWWRPFVAGDAIAY